MIDNFLEKFKQIITSRLIPIFILLFILFGILIHRLFVIQIIEGKANSSVSTLQKTKTIVTDASRGMILASGGEVLADNELVYTVELYDVLSSNNEKNEMVAYLVETLEEYGNIVDVSFPISYDGEFNFTVTDKSLQTFKENVFASKELDEEKENATAEEVFHYLRDTKFKVDKKYNNEEALKIVAIRYAMFIMWPPHNPLIVSSGIDEKTVVAIKERQSKLSGVEIGKESKRIYAKEGDPEPFAHILGYTGLISEKELEDLNEEKKDSYDSFDIIGKTGVEASFEEILSGDKGSRTMSVDVLNKPIEEISKIDPVAGKDIYLTIQNDLQRAVYQLVEQKLAGILLSKINNSKNAGTKGQSSSNIRIPIYDVYFAFINNSIIDIDHFYKEDATDLEKKVYQSFLSKQNSVFQDLDEALAFGSKRTNKELSEEMNDYISHIFDLLKEKNILNKEEVDREDPEYLNYTKDNISFSQFLEYAISNNWIDLTSLDIGNQYYKTNELYDKLMDYIKELLIEDKEFHKLLYYYLIDSYKLSGNEICLLLFDQGVLEYKEEDVTKLKNGSLSSYTFITNKIRNLEIKPSQLGLEPFSASVIVTDVKTGKILSLVSYPSYDNNHFADYLGNNLTSPLYLRAVREALAPGSTFKVASAIAGLEENVITPYEKIKDEYLFTKTTPPARCHTNNHGHVNVTEALEVSCNYFFYELGYRLGSGKNGFSDALGLEKIEKYANLLGLGSTDTNLESELSTSATTGISTDSAVRSAIGQGNHLITPAQLSTYVTAVANRGKRYDLTVIDKFYDGNSYVENQAEYEQIDEISDRTWDLVQEGMYLVGNGKKSSISHLFKDLAEAGVPIAGKTGTAQISKYHANHALFVSYGPYENPEISVTVVIPNAYTSGNAAELGRDIYSYYFKTEDEATLLDGKAKLPKANTSALAD